MRLARSGVITAGVAFALLACARHVQRQLVAPDAAATLDRRSAFLKIHLRDGRLYVLSAWQVDTVGRSVGGTGRRYGPDRVAAESGSYTVPIDSVDLFETNVVSGSPNVAAFTAMTVITGAVALACLTNPKACFGSCPTFYARTDGGERLLAEAFSSSIAPALEARDVDALDGVRSTGRSVDIVMRNEAWETHVVRYVRVLAVPRTSGGRVFATADGEFIQTDQPASPARCWAAEGDCRELLGVRDGRERTSDPDSTDLAAREEVELEFAAPAGGATGVVIAYRQTLLTTYLFYQGLAWMGDRAGEWLAAMNRAPATRQASGGLGSVLGKIEVLVDSGGGWMVVGQVGETGPLASDVKIVPLPEITGDGPTRVRLRLTRGLWRLDQVALARLGARVTPTRLAPARVTAPSRDAAELRAWTADSTRMLVTLPGDEVALRFDLPDEPGRVELFLEARGYYLEWMREAWLAEADPARAARLYLDPQGSLRELAPTFSRLEPELERIFWSSRYARP